MAYKRFVLNILLRLIALFLSFWGILIIIVVAQPSQMIVTFILSIMVAILLIYNLITYIIKYYNDLSRLIESIRKHDFQLSFDTVSKEGRENKILTSFNEIIGDFRELRIEKEVHYQFLKEVVESLNAGLLVYDNNDDIVLINSTAEKLLSTRNSGSLEQIGKYAPWFIDGLHNMDKGVGGLIESPDKSMRIKLSSHKTGIMNMGEERTIVLFQDITNEIDRQEIDSWIKIIGTLNHEIMNSLTPVASLAGTMKMIIENSGSRGSDQGILDRSSIDDLYRSAETIETRSRGLVNFVEQYRKLTGIPAPAPVKVELEGVLNEIVALFSNSLDEEGIELMIKSKRGASVYADRDLLLQVLINLIKNSVEATDRFKGGRITIETMNHDGRDIIRVADNGKGISPEEEELIFTPFYTTRQDGSGIGLSLCRQIISAHGGSITYSPAPGGGSVFTLVLKGRY